MVTRDPERRQDEPSGRRRSSAALFAAAVVALAGGLRLWHVRHGLPDFLDEAIPFRVAFDMWGWNSGHTDLNPHFFNYPSLTIYLQFWLQKAHCAVGHLLGWYASPSDYWLSYHIDPSAHALVARLVGVASDVATVLAVWRIGERIARGAGAMAAWLVAFCGTMIVTSRAVYADPVTGALSIWAIERLLAWRANGGSSRLAAAVLLIGLATGAKYTAGLLVLPLGWALWARCGLRGLRLWPALAAAAVGVFLMTSPYVILDFDRFLADFAFESRHMATGHLGSLGQSGAMAQLETAGQDLGWPAVALLAVALITTVRLLRRRAREPEIGLWLALLPGTVSVAIFRMEAGRYLVPLLPIASLLVAVAIVSACRLLRVPRSRLLFGLCVVGLVVLPTLNGIQAARGGRFSNRALARRWCETHLQDADLVVQEPYGARLASRRQRDRVLLCPSYPAASPSLREAFLAKRLFLSAELPMAASGQFAIRTRDQDGHRIWLPVFEHASEFNRIFYEPSLYGNVDYFVTSGSLRSRYSGAPHRYAAQVSFYRLLDDRAEVAARFAATAESGDAAVTIYRLGPAFAAQLQSDHATFDPLWWAADIPGHTRRRLETLLSADRRCDGCVRLPDGRPAPWISMLDSFFDERIRPFLGLLASFQHERGQRGPSRDLLRSILAVVPEHVPSCLLWSQCCTELGDWELAEAGVARSERIVSERGGFAPDLLLEHARVLDHLGRRDEARRRLANIIERATPDSEAVRRARQWLAAWDRIPTRRVAE